MCCSTTKGGMKRKASLKFNIFQAIQKRGSNANNNKKNYSKSGTTSSPTTTIIIVIRRVSEREREHTYFSEKKNFMHVCYIVRCLNSSIYWFFLLLHLLMRENERKHIYVCVPYTLVSKQLFNLPLLYFPLFCNPPRPQIINFQIYTIWVKCFSSRMSRLWWSIYGIFCGCYVCIFIFWEANGEVIYNEDFLCV